MVWEDKRTKMTIIALLAAGLIVRFYFYFGHVFSDDAYYSYLAHTLYSGEFGADYLGYPVCLVRKGISALTAISFFLFGTNEASATVFPMIFSFLNMILAYTATKVITRSEISSVIVLLLTAFYPTEVLFASIAFTDMFSAFFINSGILLLFMADRDKKYSYSVLSGLLFFISVLFKINVFYTSILLSTLFIFVLIKKRSLNLYIFISLSVLVLGIMLEGYAYYLSNGDFFYRLTVMSSYSDFSKHDFAQSSGMTLMLENFTAVFLRRTMIFIPLIAVLQLVINRKERKNRLVVYWFSGLLILYLFFTMSLSEYKLIPLRFTWYLFPLFLPSMMVASKLISSLKKGWMVLSLAGYIVYSLYMTQHFRTYFDLGNADLFRHAVKAEPDRIIYTDHFTKYSIDLIDGYKKPSRTVRLNHEMKRSILANSLAVYHSGHTSELNKQGFDYPDEEYFINNGFEEINRFGSFVIYEKK